MIFGHAGRCNWLTYSRTFKTRGWKYKFDASQRERVGRAFAFAALVNFPSTAITWTQWQQHCVTVKSAAGKHRRSCWPQLKSPEEVAHHVPRLQSDLVRDLHEAWMAAVVSEITNVSAFCALLFASTENRHDSNWVRRTSFVRSA